MNFTIEILVLLAAVLYSSVGHGGASAYLAIFSIFNYTPYKIVQNVLILNILVSSISFYNYFRQGYFNRKIFLSFALTSIPASFIGASLDIDNKTYSLIFFFVLLFSSFRLVFSKNIYIDKKTSILNNDYEKYPLVLYLIVGGIIGFISGIIGVGGGIFLSPFLILTGICNSKITSGISSAFIVVNSISALIAQVIKKPIILEPNMFSLTVSVFIGAVIGSYLGANKFKYRMVCQILGFVLIIAAFKMLLSVL